jgi:mannosyltransferase OCH1-like enzyme
MEAIPKTTHQIWFQGWKNLPEKYTKNVQSLRNLNENWEHLTWDEDSLRIECEKFSPEAAAKFDNFGHMMRKIVFGRYVVLYHYGGISIDCDAECLRPLDKIPGIKTESLIISKSPFKFEDDMSLRGLNKDLIMFNCATIACTKKNPIMKQFIEFLINNESWDPDSQFEEQIQTGPLITSIFFNHFLDEISILDSEIIEPLGHLTKRTVLNHKYELSWVHPALRFLKEPYFFARNHNFEIFTTLAVLQCIIIIYLLLR